LSRKQGILLGVALLLATVATTAGTPVDSRDDFQALLAQMHPDYASYIAGIHGGITRFHPASLYMGLVRAGGIDPTYPGDSPLVGRGVRNDIVVYADSREAGRSDGWAMLLIDHEYFHARHLARGDKTPTPTFGDPEVDRHFYEAVAWEYNLAQADDDDYPGLTHADYLEAFKNYTMHFEAFRDFVLRHDHHAWAYYKLFLPDPSLHQRTVLAKN
jgi:hypothetical protein